MNSPCKYCLVVYHDEPFVSGCSQIFYSDYAEAYGDFRYCVDDGRKCVLYRMLDFDNFDL